MKNKKTVIIISVIIVAYLAFAIIFFGLDSFKDKIYGMEIMVSTGAKWRLEDGNWLDIENDDNSKKFNVYIDNKLIGNYSLLYNKRWYVYDSNKKQVEYDISHNIIGISGNKKYEIIDFDKESFDTNGENLLKEILNKKNIKLSEEFQGSKITIDIDSDGEQEKIYYASNAFEEGNINNRFSIIFIKDDIIDIVYEDYKEESMQYEMCIPSINNIIDINKDSKYELITRCKYYSRMGSDTSLYELENGKYKLIKETKR